MFWTSVLRDGKVQHNFSVTLDQPWGMHMVGKFYVYSGESKALSPTFHEMQPAIEWAKEDTAKSHKPCLILQCVATTAPSVSVTTTPADAVLPSAPPNETITGEKP